MTNLVGVSFEELSEEAQQSALTGMLLHLREILGPVEGLGERSDPRLIEYFISKLKPRFRSDGSLALFSTLYNPISRRIYEALYEGYRPQRNDVEPTNGR
jgi:hypothetical protein